MGRSANGGGIRIRTGEWRFCRPLPYRLAMPPRTGAGDGTRTRDINLGKVALYQLSYSRRVEKYM